MTIDLATIDFCPGNGGGEAVIRSLTATENGVYRAPSGVDGYNPVTVSLPLDDYATKEWVAEQGYVTGSWVEAQDYLAEDDPVIEPLTDLDNGVLSNLVVEGRSSYNRKPSELAEYNIDPHMILSEITYVVGGNAYILLAQRLYKFNKNLFNFYFDHYVDYNGEMSSDPVWEDETGRIFQGVGYEYYAENNLMDVVDLGVSSGYVTDKNRHNIYKGNNGIYLLDPAAPKKYNESLKTFESFTITFPASITGANLCNMFEWNGHHLLCMPDSPYGIMYELVEGENSAELVLVSSPYFDMNTDPEGSGFNVYNDPSQQANLVYVGGNLYYFSWESYILTAEGHWESIEIHQPENNGSTIQLNGYGVVFDEYMLGYNLNSTENNIDITNPSSETFNATGWKNLDEDYVSLTGYQTISGGKVFEQIADFKLGIMTNSVAGYTEGTPSNLHLSGNDIIAESKNYRFNCSGLVAINDVNVATVDKCILNVTTEDVGPYFTGVVNDIPYGNWNYQNYFTVPSGRVFFGNVDEWGAAYFEFDGSAWNQISFTYNILPQSVMNAIGNTFAFDNNNNIYLWDEGNSDWVLINNSGTYGYSSYIWICGDTIRYHRFYKLVNDGGTWTWTNDPISGTRFNSGVYVVYNNTVYCIGSRVYSYDESTKSYSSEINRCNYPKYVFQFNGNLYYMNSTDCYMIDFSQASGTQEEFNKKTQIYCSIENVAYFAYGNKLWTLNTVNYSTGYVYGLEYEVPEVPSTNGTYTLQATRSGDTVTFSWVPGI